jgi:hypothetical protein
MNLCISRAAYHSHFAAWTLGCRNATRAELVGVRKANKNNPSHVLRESLPVAASGSAPYEHPSCLAYRSRDDSVICELTHRIVAAGRAPLALLATLLPRDQSEHFGGMRTWRRSVWSCSSTGHQSRFSFSRCLYIMSTVLYDGLLSMDQTCLVDQAAG